MLLAVPPRVQRGVAQAEVGRQIDDLVRSALEIRSQLLGHAVGQGQEHEVEPVSEAGVVGLEPRTGIRSSEARIQVGDLAARLRLPHGLGQLELGVLEAQAKQLSPGVARGPDDADSIHGR